MIRQLQNSQCVGNDLVEFLSISYSLDQPPSVSFFDISYILLSTLFMYYLRVC